MSTTILNLQIADKISSGVIEACKSNGFAPITVNVLDASGLVIVTKRMDGCAPVGIPEFSFAKAYTCIATKNCSRAFRDKYTSSGDPGKFCQMTSMVSITNGKMAPFPGGVLIKSESGVVLGAVGVSGASGDEDEFCALQGVKNAGLTQVKTIPEESVLKPVGKQESSKSEELSSAEQIVKAKDLNDNMKDPVDIIIPSDSKFYDKSEQDPNFDSLVKIFKTSSDYKASSVRSITTSGNSYSQDACKVLASLLKDTNNLMTINFSDMFTQRLRSDLPGSLKILMDSVLDKNIISLNLSHNAFGPIGIKSFQEFLEKATILQVLDVTNCGITPQGGQMVAESMLKNKSLKLREFYASRDRLEQEGLQAISEALAKQKCLEKIEVYQNGSKESLKHFFAAMTECKDTLKYVNVQDNKPVNDGIPEMIKFIKECKNLEYLNISDVPMTKSNCKLVYPAIIEACKSGSKLKTLEWNYVLGCSISTAKEFLKELSSNLSGQTTSLESLSMVGIFQLKENRDSVKEFFKSVNLEVKLELFKPEYTDDESEDHDCSEDESKASDYDTQNDDL